MNNLAALAITLSLGIVLGGLLIGLTLTVRAQGDPARETRVPGDTNCDQQLDLSDAIFTLNYLFVGTVHPPCPLADRPELLQRITDLETQLAQCRGGFTECESALDECLARPRLLATGQDKCYDVIFSDGSETSRIMEVPCGTEFCKGQDRNQNGCPSQGRFIDNGDSTISDKCTGLMWQNLQISDIPTFGRQYMQWCEAVAWCENLKFAGHDDWRLPNIRELESIVDYGHNNPASDPVFLVFGEDYWSSTPVAREPYTAWYIRMLDGMTMVDENVTRFVRAVRNSR